MIQFVLFGEVGGRREWRNGQLPRCSCGAVVLIGRGGGGETASCRCLFVVLSVVSYFFAIILPVVAIDWLLPAVYKSCSCWHFCHLLLWGGNDSFNQLVGEGG